MTTTTTMTAPPQDTDTLFERLQSRRKSGGNTPNNRVAGEGTSDTLLESRLSSSARCHLPVSLSEDEDEDEINLLGTEAEAQELEIIPNTRSQPKKPDKTTRKARGQENNTKNKAKKRHRGESSSTSYSPFSSSYSFSTPTGGCPLKRKKLATSNSNLALV